MNHLLEAWITWIKYKPYFTARTNSKTQRTGGMGWGERIKTKTKKMETKRDLWGGTLCQSEGGGVVKTHTSGIHIARGWGRNQSWKYNGKWTAKKKKKKRWREQRQWLIHEQSHVLNFLKELGGMREGGLLKTSVYQLSTPHSLAHYVRNKKIL